mmetsp:Transcript_69081/g.131784  ORF Transcript_69081/g.131784 Transcript_69081/m.131784 type:complete len:594 (-) Transcript_69081:170-1951(-)
MSRRDIWDSFPVSRDAVNDLNLEWPIAGGFKRLPSDAAFTAAFQSLDIPKSWKPVTRSSFQGLAGWKQKQIIDALCAPVAYTYRFPHAEVEGFNDLDRIDWSACVGVQRSDDGSEGVLFVELPGKRAVVVKAPVHVASEMFGNVLCGQLGVMCPNVRLVTIASNEGRSLLEALVRADEWRDPEERRVLRMLSGRPLLLVIEYVQAQELASMFLPASRAWSKEAFGLHPGDSPASLSDRGKEVLRSLGTFVALDMIINNFDRLPCVWDNQGNAGNLMFAKGTYEPLSIDNMVCCIPPQNEKAIAKYLDRVREVVADCKRHLEHGVEQLEFSRIRCFLKDGNVQGQGWTGLGIDIGIDGTLEIQKGFMNAVHRAVYGNGSDSEQITLEWLDDIRDALLQQLPGEKPLHDAPMHMYGFGFIHPQFCASVIEAFQDAIERDDDDLVNKSRRESGKKLQRSAGSIKCIAPARICSNGTMTDGDKQLAMFMSPEQRQTFLEYHDRRKAQLKVDAASKLKMKPHKSREEAAKKVRGGPSGYYPLASLACLPPWPAGVEAARREMWLSPEDFQQVFGMDKAEFRKLPSWTQQHKKKKANLF